VQSISGQKAAQPLGTAVLRKSPYLGTSFVGIPLTIVTVVTTTKMAAFLFWNSVRQMRKNIRTQ
jgi:hypothetical protein